VPSVAAFGTIDALSGGCGAWRVWNAMVEWSRTHKKRGSPQTADQASAAQDMAAEGLEAWRPCRSPRFAQWLRGPLLPRRGGPTAINRHRAAHFAGAPLDLTANATRRTGRGRGRCRSATARCALWMQGRVTNQCPVFAKGIGGFRMRCALPVKILCAAKGQRAFWIFAPAPGGKTIAGCAAAGATGHGR